MTRSEELPFLRSGSFFFENNRKRVASRIASTGPLGVTDQQLWFLTHGLKMKE
ncbi:hypothetical protein SAMN03080617_01563 [Algoriphagus alkaliphilus]|uniref:Uncharacterized protein n=1 Tax=Algoriphagus alkaliphilus TaxID=279824 RepID=A0A1G5X713_9BACT|nr:hypothetical protein SAMN03080617_01563 [Algoriphagus alkaliphilus]